MGKMKVVQDVVVRINESGRRLMVDDRAGEFTRVAVGYYSSDALCTVIFSDGERKLAYRNQLDIFPDFAWQDYCFIYGT